MKLTIYHLKNCDTCKKAIKALEAAGHALDLIEVRDEGMETATLSKFVEILGFEAVLNTRSTTWRGLDDDAKADMDSAKAISLMGEHPTLIKRPAIDAEGSLSVGWTKQVQEALL